MQTPFRLLVVDDHPVVLFGLRLSFKDHPDFTIVAEAATAAEACAAMEMHKPDFVVTDLVMGERDGIDLLEDLVTIHPSAGVLVYSSHDEQDTRVCRSRPEPAATCAKPKDWSGLSRPWNGSQAAILRSVPHFK